MSKPWKVTEMALLKKQYIQLPAKPGVMTVDSAMGTPVGELPDRTELEGLHSSVGMNNNNLSEKEAGKPRRRSIGEGLG